ncbi:MAG: transketolase [Acidobacteria bacterium]|nr:transketolase [Acidobacteriota bacterium]
MANLDDMTVEELSIATIRTLSMDAVQKADSGHPGTPMALAPLAYVLWKRFLRFNPENPDWFDRDRFVLSCGHASMLLYAMLHLTGYDLPIEDIRRFRQWGSKALGHPERGVTPGVETTTGPLGQGIMVSVGLAMAEAHLAATFNRDGHEIIDHYTYAFCSDGDLMEGASSEAASLAGHFGLGKLIWIYDNNQITIEGATGLTYSEDVTKRFEGYGWHVQNIGDKANDLDALTAALGCARAVKDRPSIIIVRSHIGYGAPNKQDTSDAHGAPLGEAEIKLTKKFYGWPEDAKFLVPERVLEHMREAVARGKELESAWKDRYAAWQRSFPELARKFEEGLGNAFPAGWDENFPVFRPADGPIATRSASQKVVNTFSNRIPWLLGGSADLAPSTKTLMKGTAYFEKGEYANRNIAWGIREHCMAAATSGICLHGGLRAFAATFFVFTDYARPAIRLAAMMKLPVIYVMTHDSIGLGEDGPTHQPVEHLASLRAMPGMCVIRPADANEVSFAWRAALLRQTGPTVLALSRQNLPVFDRTLLAGAEGALKGAYVLSREKGMTPAALLIASGSEVELALAAQQELAQEGIDTRVVSMPSWELFREQPPDYREGVLPALVKARVAVEAGVPMGWCEWVGERGHVIGITRFGASAPYQELYQRYGITVESIVSAAKRAVRGSS